MLFLHPIMTLTCFQLNCSPVEMWNPNRWGFFWSTAQLNTFGFPSPSFVGMCCRHAIQNERLFVKEKKTNNVHQLVLQISCLCSTVYSIKYQLKMIFKLLYFKFLFWSYTTSQLHWNYGMHFRTRNNATDIWPLSWITKWWWAMYFFVHLLIGNTAMDSSHIPKMCMFSWIEYKLCIGVYVTVIICLPMCPGIGWQLVQGVHHLSPWSPWPKFSKTTILMKVSDHENYYGKKYLTLLFV